MFLQRSLQKGRDALLGAYTLSPAQCGQATIRGERAPVGSVIFEGSADAIAPSGAQGQLEGRVVVADLQPLAGRVLHQAHCHHQTVAADLGHQAL